MSNLKLLLTIMQIISIAIFSIAFLTLTVSSVVMTTKEKKLARYGECHLEKQFSNKVDLNNVKVSSREWECWSLKRELEFADENKEG